jgi:Response regulators consisting of a CheY-like receiver domain and a winged-helix DNA-binding domain
MKMKIAIVTDVPLFCNIFIPLLNMQNTNVLVDVCNSIDEIDKKIDLSTYNLVLVDGGMSHMSCFEAIQHIRFSKQAAVPIWFFPEIQTEEYIIKSRILGVSRIIPKPFDPLKISKEIFDK